MKDPCNIFVKLIIEDLDILFRDEGFTIIDKRAVKKEHCLIFMESNHFRIKGYYGPDYVDLLIGTKAAPLSWEDKSDGVINWYSIGLIDGYLRDDLTVHIPSAEERERNSLEVQARQITQLVTQHYTSLKKMFSQGNRIQDIKNLNKYINAREQKARTMYENLARNKLDT